MTLLLTDQINGSYTLRLRDSVYSPFVVANMTVELN